MGYTTEFEGSFNISPPLNEHQANTLIEFSETRHGGNTEVHDGMPGFWCQWTTCDGGRTLQWDGGEKFYDYVAWLEYLIENFFEPNKRTLTGKVRWRGEEFDDIGIITVTDNRVDVRDSLDVF